MRLHAAECVLALVMDILARPTIGVLARTTRHRRKRRRPHARRNQPAPARAVNEAIAQALQRIRGSCRPRVGLMDNARMRERRATYLERGRCPKSRRSGCYPSRACSCPTGSGWGPSSVGTSICLPLAPFRRSGSIPRTDQTLQVPTEMPPAGCSNV